MAETRRTLPHPYSCPVPSASRKDSRVTGWSPPAGRRARASPAAGPPPREKLSRPGAAPYGRGMKRLLVVGLALALAPRAVAGPSSAAVLHPGVQPSPPTAAPARAPLRQDLDERRAIRGCEVSVDCRHPSQAWHEIRRRAVRLGQGRSVARRRHRPAGHSADPAGRDLAGGAASRAAMAGAPDHARPAGAVGRAPDQVPGVLQGRPPRPRHHEGLARGPGPLPRHDPRPAAAAAPARGPALRRDD